MMRHVFITASGRSLKRWDAAFPQLVVQPSVDAFVQKAQPADVVWLDADSFGETESETAVRDLVSSGVSVVALSGHPSQTEAFAYLSAGARGYCHVEAVPEQLLEVATVVGSGGLWMPGPLIQRLVRVANRTSPDTPQPPTQDFSELTQREYDVAKQVGQGANNKEIADALGVSERTVKAHLTAIFEKLGVRDRVQLALAVNRLPIH